MMPFLLQNKEDKMDKNEILKKIKDYGEINKKEKTLNEMLNEIQSFKESYFNQKIFLFVYIVIILALFLFDLKLISPFVLEYEKIIISGSREPFAFGFYCFLSFLLIPYLLYFSINDFTKNFKYLSINGGYYDRFESKFKLKKIIKKRTDFKKVIKQTKSEISLLENKKNELSISKHDILMLKNEQISDPFLLKEIECHATTMNISFNSISCLKERSKKKDLIDYMAKIVENEKIEEDEISSLFNQINSINKNKIHND